MWWLLVAACTVNEGGPATPGSPAAAAQQDIADLSARAARIEALATELEAMSDTARETMPGKPRADHVAKMRELMATLSAENDALQSELSAMEASLHAAAGDPTLGAAPEE